MSMRTAYRLKAASFMGILLCLIVVSRDWAFQDPCPTGPSLQAVGLPLSSVTVKSGNRRFYMGFTPWAYAGTPQAVAETYRFIRESADIITQHIEGVPWTGALAGAPFPKGFMDNISQRKKNQPSSLKRVLAISPLNQGRNGLADYYGEKEHMPLPKEFKGKHFNDPAVKTAYLNYCHRMIEFFQPNYLIVGIESNELLKNTPAEWGNYVELSRYVYSQLKQAVARYRYHRRER
jgi:hypothetical protein